MARRLGDDLYFFDWRTEKVVEAAGASTKCAGTP